MKKIAGIRCQPFVVGINHRTSSMALRDRAFVEDKSAHDFLHELANEGVDQVLVLSTCDRVEIQAVGDSTLSEKIFEILAKHSDCGVEQIKAQSYFYENEDAVKHIFRVAASLDSQIIGEPQVFGQVKVAYRMARDVGCMGPELDALIQSAFTTAKRVLSETKVGHGPVSIAAVAVGVSQDLHGDLSSCNGLLIGNGEMGQLIGESLLKNGLGSLVVTHPLPTRISTLAETLHCNRVNFENLSDHLAKADIVLSALGRGKPVLSADIVYSVVRRRRYHPVFIADLAVPGDVEAAAHRIDGAFLYDIQDLERLASASQAQRRIEAEAGENIVMEEVASYLGARTARAAVPQLNSFRGWAEHLRIQVMAEAPDDAERATHLLLNRFLHDPSIALKNAARVGDRRMLEQALRQLFPGMECHDANKENKDRTK
ncbi:MAG: glutamyl-tRNA reductase [Rhodospirillaceae bacterium TMED8]|nr:glutamyl-tRNA reductase [Magnetovibrio sp.]OUT53278.1 MAG: glutamyl-tRNA reductase [Rhodospirillaceae bacterium TMED8]|tara:strand:- start:327 stop:1613 length:1287 start_codon:yes stop_codon:yes gene_type:complete